MPDAQPSQMHPSAEQLMASTRQRIAFPATPDLRARLRARIEASTMTPTGSSADPFPAAPSQKPPGNLRMLGKPTSRRREIATLAAGIAAFAVVATALALIFGYSDWRGASDTPGAIEDGPASAVVAEPTATEPAAAAAPLLPTPSSAIPLEHPALQELLIATTDESEITALHKVDAETLSESDGSTPLVVTEPREAIAEHAYSYDGGFLALAIRDDTGASKKVKLVDLNAWSMTEVPVPEPPAPVSISNRILRFVPGSNDLLWASSRTPHEFRIVRYSVETAQSTIVELPEGCVPVELYPLANDQRVAVACSMFGPAGGFSTDVMHVLIADLDSGSVTSDIRLEGVDSGALEATTSETDGWPFHNITPGLAFDRQRSLLYVVPVSGEQLTVVDLNAGAIHAQVNWAPDASWLERLTGWFAPQSAQAIARAISYGYAALSPDGEHLYIATASEQLTEDRRTTEEINASAFIIIDTATLEVTQRLDLGMVRAIVAGPGDEQVVVYTNPHIYPVGDYATSEGHALYLVNAASGDVVQQLDLTGHPRRPMMHNGGYVYLELSQTGGREWLVVDPTTMTIIESNADPDATRLIVP